MRSIPVLALIFGIMLPAPAATGSEGMTESQAWGAMFRAASAFASEKTPAWNRNAVFYVIWRLKGAEITRDCFFGERGECLFMDKTDKELVTILYEKLKDGEARDAGLQRSIREDRSGLPYASYFAAALLKPNIGQAYENAKKELSKTTPAPSPELIVSYLGAVARRLREVAGQDLTGWTPADLLGWIVLYHPGWGEETANFAARLANIPIPYLETDRR